MFKLITIAAGIYFMYRMIFPASKSINTEQNQTKGTPNVIDVDYEEVD